MRKILFLDLEDTVIDEFRRFGDACLMNIAAVRKFIEAEQPDEVRLFTFAFSGDQCVRQFEATLAARLNGALNVQLNLTDAFTTGMLFRMCRQHGTVFEDENECMLLHGKEYGFQHFIEMSAELDNTEVVLVDDAVRAKTIRLLDTNTAIRMVPVNSLL